MSIRTSIKQEFYNLRDSGVDPVEAIERVAAGRYLSPRDVAIRCDLAPTFVAKHWSDQAVHICPVISVNAFEEAKRRWDHVASFDPYLSKTDARRALYEFLEAYLEAPR